MESETEGVRKRDKNKVFYARKRSVKISKVIGK
jgi:hypothetical protein